MKTTLLTLATAALGLFTTTASAQVAAVPNGTFDTWATRTGLEVPQNWTTVDEAIESDPDLSALYSSTTTTKDPGSRTGAFAAKMESKNDLILSLFLGGPIPGGVLLGTAVADDALLILETQSVSAVGGLPFTTRAASMQFYYKLTGTNALADSAYALVSLTRTTGGVVQTIASGSARLTPAAAYTLNTIPLQYTSSLVPDSIHIGFISGIGARRTDGTTLTVDDVTMNGVVASTRDAQLTAALNVYPNPSNSGLFTLAARGRENELAGATLTVSDLLGRTVLTQPATRAAQPRTLDLSAQPTGVYTLRLDTPAGYVVQKLLKP